jgi:hypothetical protein
VLEDYNVVTQYTTITKVIQRVIAGYKLMFTLNSSFRFIINSKTANLYMLIRVKGYNKKIGRERINIKRLEKFPVLPARKIIQAIHKHAH